MSKNSNKAFFRWIYGRSKRFIPSVLVISLLAALISVLFVGLALVSKTVLEKGLDAGTAFEILSIDIADVDVGRNIGAALMTDQAEADKRIAQARAEERRAMAVAKEQEMKAYTQEMQAKVVEAQAKVPAALADALENGRLGVMDYYRMNNINADTEMRKTIAEVSPLTEKEVDGK